MSEALLINNLVKTYPDFQLGPLDLKLETGTILGFVGPNGAGKSTTLHCIVGLLKLKEGYIEIFGRRNDPRKPTWKHDVGYVGDTQIFYENWNGYKNLKFLSHFYPNWSDDLAAKLTDRFKIPLEKKAKNLSTGNRIKLALIGALAYSPKLLLLDEPTAGLDPIVRVELLDFLFETAENGDRAILYSTHILSDINRLADELAFISNGSIVLRKTIEELNENWRTISFLYSGDISGFDAVKSYRQQDKRCQVISSIYELTLKQLSEVGADNIQVNLMSVEDIAVHILREADNV
jgi:ABC-2 type transport system ATP-binding protein